MTKYKSRQTKRKIKITNKTEHIVDRNSVPKTILGFSIIYSKKTGKWQAGRSIDGKTRTVYIGFDPTQAEKKIRSWVYANGFEIDEDGNLTSDSITSMATKIQDYIDQLNEIKIKIDTTLNKLGEELDKLRKQDVVITETTNYPNNSRQ